MQKFITLSLLIGLLALCFSQDRSAEDPSSLKASFEQAASLYRRADEQVRRAGDNETLLVKADSLYKQALTAFNKMLPLLERSNKDSLALITRIRTGYIHYYFGESLPAKKDYLAILSKGIGVIPDSLLFIPSLYTGGIYYETGQFDSALYYYKKAEQVNDHYEQHLPGAERLFNRLGAMYYEMGNYKLAHNYFENAIALTPASDKDLVVNYRINMASLLIKLEEYDSAETIFKHLLPSPAYQNEIYHNLGVISQRQNNPRQALRYFDKVKYSDNKKQTDLFYNYAVAYASLGQHDPTRTYIEKALEENKRWYGRGKSVTHGLIMKLRGDEDLKQHAYSQAIGDYQQAIIQFHYTYNDTNARHNPEQFAGAFSFLHLFNTLVAKAGAQEAWSQQTDDTTLLALSLHTYQAAFKLATYVERTYTSDEARLFLGKLKYTVHSRPIDIALRLFDRTHDKGYLEAAYQFDQQNKASSLSLNIEENALRFENEGSNLLVRQELLLKNKMTRLQLKATNITGSTAQDSINALIGEAETELNKLEEKLNSDPSWAAKRNINRIPTVAEVQDRLDAKTVLLSYHISDSGLVTLLISPHQFAYRRTWIGSSFFDQIAALKNALYNARADQRYTGAEPATALYNNLIRPWQQELSGVTRLVIIPDDELNYLPFDVLQDKDGSYLVQHYSIQYQYSTALLYKKNETLHQGKDVLSFAPFNDPVTGLVKDSLEVLPASADEVKGLPGTLFLGHNATKSNFLSSANHFATIHLATHASVNNDDPSRSYIAFYPGVNDYKLYGAEIAGLRLDSTDLIILSACETGAGQLVRGEGLMSLSRAFAYAGCANVITSLWKAEDLATAYLTKRLHYYLDQHDSKDLALQKAKLDLLNDPGIDSRLKSPNFWAHLVFIGEYEPGAAHSNNLAWLLSAALAILIAIYFAAKSLLARNKQARFP